MSNVKPMLPSNITELLKGVNDNPDDENKAYLLAATFNLYMEAMRRFHGRILLGPADIRCVLEMAHTMMVAPPKTEKTFAPSAKARELTSVEQDQLQHAIAGDRRA